MLKTGTLNDNKSCCQAFWKLFVLIGVVTITGDCCFIIISHAIDYEEGKEDLFVLFVRIFMNFIVIAQMFSVLPSIIRSIPDRLNERIFIENKNERGSIHLADYENHLEQNINVQLSDEAVTVIPTMNRRNRSSRGLRRSSTEPLQYDADIYATSYSTAVKYYIFCLFTAIGYAIFGTIDLRRAKYNTLYRRIRRVVDLVFTTYGEFALSGYLAMNLFIILVNCQTARKLIQKTKEDINNPTVPTLYRKMEKEISRLFVDTSNSFDILMALSCLCIISIGLILLVANDWTSIYYFISAIFVFTKELVLVSVVFWEYALCNEAFSEFRKVLGSTDYSQLDQEDRNRKIVLWMKAMSDPIQFQIFYAALERKDFFIRLLIILLTFLIGRYYSTFIKNPV